MTKQFNIVFTQFKVIYLIWKHKSKNLNTLEWKRIFPNT
jgi:hypothetical protein